MKFLSKTMLTYVLFIFLGCNSPQQNKAQKNTITQDVEMTTSFGTIIMRLSDETPKHRDNFIKLVNEKFYDSIAFHRVINNFLVQTGDHKTRPRYTPKNFDFSSLPADIDAEFTSNLFHKRGALNAAREGDYANPSRASHGSQFTIIQGVIQTDSTLNRLQKRVNEWSAKNTVINRPEYQNDFKKYKILSKKIDDIEAKEIEISEADIKKTKADFKALNDKIKAYNIDSLAKITLKTMTKYEYPKLHREVYKTIGGTPHLDQNYTVFGEVVKGMNVVDSIAAVTTNKGDKPVADVYILSAKMIDRKSYKKE